VNVHFAAVRNAAGNIVIRGRVPVTARRFSPGLVRGGKLGDEEELCLRLVYHRQMPGIEEATAKMAELIVDLQRPCWECRRIRIQLPDDTEFVIESANEAHEKDVTIQHLRAHRQQLQREIAFLDEELQRRRDTARKLQREIQDARRELAKLPYAIR
jgi:hypothetical protein